jgi:hypothetical protein
MARAQGRGRGGRRGGRDGGFLIERQRERGINNEIWQIKERKVRALWWLWLLLLLKRKWSFVGENVTKNKINVVLFSLLCVSSFPD